MKIKLLSLFALVILFSQCVPNEVESPNFDFKKDYLPLEIGKTVEYRVDSLIFDDSGNVTKQSYLRETVRDFYIDESQDTVYRIERFVKDSLRDPWSFSGLHAVSIVDNEAIRIQNNLRLIKLIFPPVEGFGFSSTKHLDEFEEHQIGTEFLQVYKNWRSRIEKINRRLEPIANFAFVNVMTVIHAEDENLFERRYVVEKYVRGIGLVYRYEEIIDTQNPDDNKTWIEQGEKGFVTTHNIINF